MTEGETVTESKISTLLLFASLCHGVPSLVIGLHSVLSFFSMIVVL